MGGSGNRRQPMARLSRVIVAVTSSLTDVAEGDILPE